MDAGDDAELRARALQRLLPALVHRLNNALAVALGAHELGAEALASERAQASDALSTLGQALARIALLARAPATEEEPVELQALFQTHAILLTPLAASQGVELELRRTAAHAVRADGRFEGRLLATLCALLASAPGSARGRVRLSARATRRGILLLLVTTLPVQPSQELAALLEHARARGWRAATRATERASGLRLTLPAEGARAEAASAPASRPRRVLLVHGAGEERELVATLLREHGCAVSESAGEPDASRGAAGFELALVERRLAQADPGLPARLRARCAVERVELLEPRMRPGALLALLGA